MSNQQINDGGSAFPHETHNGYDSGMTLRDYFAAAALQGMLASHETTGTRDAFASAAYTYADAMLKARESK